MSLDVLRGIKQILEDWGLFLEKEGRARVPQSVPKAGVFKRLSESVTDAIKEVAHLEGHDDKPG